MPCGGDTIIILTNKSENLRTLSLEEEMESLSVVKSMERLLSVSWNATQFKELTEFTQLENGSVSDPGPPVLFV